MTVKLYSCGMMENHREREMMKALVRDLIQRFRDFDDCIIFKDNIFIILDLKSWLGEFKIDLEDHIWKANGNFKLQYYIDNLSEKPDSQVIRYSRAFKELILSKHLKEIPKSLNKVPY